MAAAGLYFTVIGVLAVLEMVVEIVLMIKRAKGEIKDIKEELEEEEEKEEEEDGKKEGKNDKEEKDEKDEAEERPMMAKDFIRADTSKPEFDFKKIVEGKVQNYIKEDTSRNFLFGSGKVTPISPLGATIAPINTPNAFKVTKDGGDFDVWNVKRK